MILGLSFLKLIGAILTGIILSGVIISMTVPHDGVIFKEEIKEDNVVPQSSLAPSQIGNIFSIIGLLFLIFGLFIVLYTLFHIMDISYDV